MSKLDLNTLVMIVAVIILVIISAMFGYRLQIGPNGLTFEHNQTAFAASNSEFVAMPPAH